MDEIVKNFPRQEITVIPSRKVLPDYVLVIVDRWSRETHLPFLPKNEFLLPNSTTMYQFNSLVREHLKLNNWESLFLFLKENGEPVTGSHTIQAVHMRFQSHGLLYLSYTSLLTFGCPPRREPLIPIFEEDNVGMEQAIEMVIQTLSPVYFLEDYFALAPTHNFFFCFLTFLLANLRLSNIFFEISDIPHLLLRDPSLRDEIMASFPELHLDANHLVPRMTPSLSVIIVSSMIYKQKRRTMTPRLGRYTDLVMKSVLGVVFIVFSQSIFTIVDYLLMSSLEVKEGAHIFCAMYTLPNFLQRTFISSLYIFLFECLFVCFIAWFYPVFLLYLYVYFHYHFIYTFLQRL